MQKYHLFLRLAHWALALLFVAIFCSVWFAGYGDLRTMYGWHKSLGLLAFGLVLLRVVVRLRAAKPAPVVESKTHSLLFRWGHRGLYALMGLVPLSMLIPASLTRGIDFFAWHFDPIAHNPELAGSIKAFHVPLAYFFAAMIVGHLFMAMYHHFVRKNGVLKRIF